MNYKIGDTVIIKNVVANEKKSDKRYTYLGLSNDITVKPITYAKFVMGENVQIGVFINTPLEIVYNSDNNNYVVKLLFFDTKLFEKDE